MDEEKKSENVQREAIPNTCTICQHTFADSDQLASHFLSFHPDLKFCCYGCHLAFSSMESLFQHMKLHDVIKPDKSRIALYDDSKHVLARIGFLEEVQKCPQISEFWGRALKVKEQKKPKPKVTVKRKRPSGSQRCCVIGCKSTCETVPKVSFFAFPKKDIQKRLLWIAVLNRKNRDGTEWKPNDSHRVCSLHFVKGKPSPTQFDIDYTPTLHVGLDEKTIKEFVESVVKADVSFRDYI